MLSGYYYNEDEDDDILEEDDIEPRSRGLSDSGDSDERQSYDRRSSAGGPRGGGSGGRFRRGRKVCYFCSNKVDHIDYKDVDLLRRFQTDRGRIRPRRQSGACAKHQRKLASAIKRARHIALLPFVVDDSP